MSIQTSEVCAMALLGKQSTKIPRSDFPFPYKDLINVEIGYHSFEIHYGVARKCEKIEQLFDESILHERVVQRMSNLLTQAEEFPSFASKTGFTAQDFKEECTGCCKTPGSVRNKQRRLESTDTSKFKTFIKKAVLGDDKDEFEDTYADLPSIVERGFKGCWHEYPWCLEHEPKGAVGKILDGFIEGCCKQFRQAIATAQEKLDVCEAQEKAIKFSDIDFPLRIAEAVVHAMYTDRVEVMHVGGKWAKPTDLLTYIQFCHLAHILGFGAIKDTALIQIYLDKDALVPSLSLRKEMRDYISDNSIKLAQLGIHTICSVIIGSAMIVQDASISEEEALQPVKERLASANPKQEHWKVHSIQERFDELGVESFYAVKRYGFEDTVLASGSFLKANACNWHELYGVGDAKCDVVHDDSKLRARRMSV